jgi:hypothetical protein
MPCLHEGVHEGRQYGTGTKNEQDAKNEQHDNKRNEPPFLLLLEEKHEFFDQLPHDWGAVYQVCGQLQTKGTPSAGDREPKSTFTTLAS